MGPLIPLSQPDGVRNSKAYGPISARTTPGRPTFSRNRGESVTVPSVVSEDPPLEGDETTVTAESGSQPRSRSSPLERLGLIGPQSLLPNGELFCGAEYTSAVPSSAIPEYGLSLRLRPRAWPTVRARVACVVG